MSAGKNHLLQWQGVKEQIQRGSSIAEALQIVTPPPSLYILSMVKAGEKTGTIGNTLSEVADDLEQECLFQRKILAALTYPLFLSGAVICVTFALSLWILPTYEKLFASLGTQLPFLTVVIFACGRYLPIVLTLLIMVGLGTLVFGRLSGPILARNNDQIHLLYPGIWTDYTFNELMHFAGFRKLLSAGIPLLECLTFCGRYCQEQANEHNNKEVTRGMSGKTLAILQRFTIFSCRACEMLNVAEKP